jgi:hypothetical protein
VIDADAFRRLVAEAVRPVLREELARASEQHDDALIDAAEGARLTRKTKAALLRAAHRGSVPSVLVGRRRMFRRSDLLGGAR